MCCALLRLTVFPTTIPPPSHSAFYEHVAIPGRGAADVRVHLYTLFPQGLSVRAIRKEMRVHLEAWCLEAGSTDSMVVVEQPVAAPVEVGAKGLSQGRSFNFSRKRPNPPDQEAGTCDAALTAHPASKIAVGA